MLRVAAAHVLPCVLLAVVGRDIADAQDLQPEQGDTLIDRSDRPMRVSPWPEQCGGEAVNSNDTPYHQNGRFTFQAVPAPHLVPYPASLRASAEYLSLRNCSLGVDDTSLLPLAKLLSAEIAASTSGAVNLSVSTTSSTRAKSSVHVISLSLTTTPPHDAADGYSLVSTATGALLSSPSYAGMVSATATLLQAIELSEDYDAVPRTKKNCSTAPEWRLPALTIQDSPAMPYRGIMVDAARAFLPVSALKGFVTLCRLYKLNYLHIHLSDDGAFTFPSTAYPELANGSSWRYSLEELQDLQSFARLRNVEIIGEIDVPGHAKSMIQSLPEVFAFPSKPVGVVDFTNGTVIRALQTIFDEIQAVFPSSYVHMGGDEVNFGEIDGLPEIAAALQKERVNSTADLYRLFIVRMHAYAASKGKTLQVWEGFKSNAPGTHGSVAPSTVSIPQDVVVSPFDCNIYVPPLLAKDGYKIINSAWTPLYIAAHGRDGMHHPVPPELVYRWNPWLFGSVIHSLEWWRIPTEHQDAVIGSQMCVWQMSAKDHMCMLSSRAPAMAERVWNPYGGRTFGDYSERVVATAKLLYKLLEVQGSLPSDFHPAPSPPSPRPLPGYMLAHGACRDASNGGSQYLFWDTRINPGLRSISLGNCSAMCAKLGNRCDAYDYSGSWCGIWGTTLTGNDNISDSCGGRWELAPALNHGGKVCRGDLSQGGNSCYLRGGATCGHAPPPAPPSPQPANNTPAQNENSQPGCLEGCGGCT